MKKKFPEQELTVDTCGCMVKREDGKIVAVKHCELHEPDYRNGLEGFY